MSTASRPPHPVAARRQWVLRVVVVLAALLQVFACQAVLAPSMGSAAVIAHEASHGIGHDVQCEAGAAALTVPVCRDGVGEAPLLPDRDVLGLALAVFGLLVIAAVMGRAGAPSWAPRLVPPGRNRLLAVGLIRV